MRKVFAIFLVTALCFSCAEPRKAPPAQPVAFPPMEPAFAAERHVHEIQRLAAERREGAIPSEDNFIWMGRRLAYLGRYDDAIAEFTEGLRHEPQSYKLLRHRGHRWITLRLFDRAVDDLARAAAMIEGVPDEIEPDGQPNHLGIPTSTSHTNIYYHLGLVHYLRSEFDSALIAFEKCMEFANNDDMRIATAYWLYLTQRRLGRDDDAMATLAPIHADMPIIENTAYHELLLLFKGERSIEDVLGIANEADARSSLPVGINDATLGYGVGMWRLLRGERDEARRIFEQILNNTPTAAFGHIAAEVELAKR